VFDFNFIHRMLLHLQQSQQLSCPAKSPSHARFDPWEPFRLDYDSPQLATDSTFASDSSMPSVSSDSTFASDSSMPSVSSDSIAAALSVESAASPFELPIDWPNPSSEEDCIHYFFHLKWPDGFRCPRCDHPHAGVITSRRLPLYECRACHHQTSLTAGTVMEASRLPLTKWFTAMRLLSSPDGLSATRLVEYIHVSYKTALAMLHKLRLVIHRTLAQHPLSGSIQWGVKCYGTNNYQPYVLHPQEHPVFVAGSFSHHFEPTEMNRSTFERHVQDGNVPSDVRWDHLALVRLSPQEPMPTQVKMQVIPTHHLEHKDLHRLSVRSWMPQHVSSPQHIHKIKLFRYAKHGELPRLFRRAKTWINRTFHGIGRTYLQLYLDEFCFRYNTTIRGECVLNKLVAKCMEMSPTRLRLTSAF